MNFWYQVDMVRRTGAKSVLEIGKGSGVVTETLGKLGIRSTTIDIDRNLTPDIEGSVTDLPLPDASFDAVLAAEVLEHLPWGEVKRALEEIHRVARKSVIITVPYPGTIFAGTIKVPFVPWVRFLFKIPHFWRRHSFDGEHYWELGKRGYSRRLFRMCVRDAGFSILEEGHSADDPGRYYFSLSV